MPHISELFDVRGRVAIITGGSRGLGREMAEALGEAGARLVLVARRVEWLEPTAEAFVAKGIDVEAVSCNVTDPVQVQHLVKVALDRFARIDILVNAAGISWGAPFEDMPLERWRQVLETNVTGTFVTTRACLGPMKTRQYGKVINVASIMGLVGVRSDILDASGYSASKGAIVALTRDLAIKYAADGIRVNCTAPGFFRTRMTEAVIDRADEHIRTAIPLGYLGRDGDVKGITLFLASPASDYVTGQVFAVDGGWTAW